MMVVLWAAGLREGISQPAPIIMMRTWLFGCAGNLLDAIVFPQPGTGIASGKANILLLG